VSEIFLFPNNYSFSRSWICCFPCPTASQPDPVLEHLRVSGYLILGGTAHKMSMYVNTSCLFSAPSGSFKSPCVHESLRGSQVEMPLCPQVVYLLWGNHSFLNYFFYFFKVPSLCSALEIERIRFQELTV
jgi:hypothetical protein